MALDRIFDTIKLRNEGKDIKKYAGNMYDDLQNVKKEMDNSTSYFDSDAGEELRRSFNTSAAKFTEFKQLMDKYGQYLIELADQKEEMDENMRAASEKIPKL